MNYQKTDAKRTALAMALAPLILLGVVFLAGVANAEKAGDAPAAEKIESLQRYFAKRKKDLFQAKAVEVKSQRFLVTDDGKRVRISKLAGDGKRGIKTAIQDGGRH